MFIEYIITNLTLDGMLVEILLNIEFYLPLMALFNYERSQ